jgi:hypothetical protein
VDVLHIGTGLGVFVQEQFGRLGQVVDFENFKWLMNVNCDVLSLVEGSGLVFKLIAFSQ